MFFLRFVMLFLWLGEIDVIYFIEWGVLRNDVFFLSFYCGFLLGFFVFDSVKIFRGVEKKDKSK